MDKNLGLYTPEERVQLGKKVIALKDLKYPSGTVQKTMTGIVKDFGRTSGNPCIQWCNGIYALAEIGTECIFVEYKDSIEYILDNLLSSMVKVEDAPCSSYTHLAQAIDALYKMAGDYKPFDPKVKEELENALECMRLLHGR